MISTITFYSLLYLISGTIVVTFAILRSDAEFFSLSSIKKIFEDLFIYILCIIIWPAIIVMFIFTIYNEHKQKEVTKLEQFSLKITDLIEKVDKQEIEKREIVHDPLNAVPTIPFGHLNSAWMSFSEQLDPQDELWTFDLLWSSPWGTKERFTGYASVRNEEINMIFHTL